MALHNKNATRRAFGTVFIPRSKNLSVPGRELGLRILVVSDCNVLPGIILIVSVFLSTIQSLED